MSTPNLENSFRVRYSLGMEGYISTAGAAKIIGCVDSRVRQLLRDGKLIGERVGRDWLVQKASAEAYRDTEHKPGPKPSQDKKPTRKPKGK